MSYQVTQTKKDIYLDHAATTPLDTSVASVIQKCSLETYGNPSSLHTIGRQAHDTLEQARQAVASLLKVSSSEIIFTGSGTESDNLAILGASHANTEHGKHIIVSQIEHKAVLTAVDRLEQGGFDVTYLPVDKDGLVREDLLSEALRDDTILISIMYANNEIGTIQPIQKLTKSIREHYKNKHTPLIHTDACQAVSLLPVSPSVLGVDLMTISGSKIYGPKGVGLLYAKKGISLCPQILGGDQEHQKRAGTENIALIAGFVEALKECTIRKDYHQAHMRELQKHFVSLLQDKIPHIIFNGHPTQRLQNIVNICIPNVEGESLLLILDTYGIYCSTGSACSAHDLSPSHVLKAIGRSDDVIHGSMRFSFGKNTTIEDLTYTANALCEAIERLLSMTASSVQIKH